MYESHYGLTAKPFSIVPNPNILFMSKNHANALTYLEYGLSEKAGFILLTGEIGAGKTTMVRHMIKKIGSQFETAVIFNTNFSPDQIFRQILDEFEVTCDTNEKDRHLAQLYDFLIERYAIRQDVLLIIDEAQNLTNEALEDIRMLSNLQADDQTLLQILLVGQPELKERLQMPEFRQFAQRIAVNYHISPLDKGQTKDYIEYRLQKAGGTLEMFSQDALDHIYEHSGGIPRTINLICDTALVYGFADNLMKIDETVIAHVIKDNICMAANEKNEGDPQNKGAAAKSDPGPDILKRIRVLEMSVKKLKLHYENLIKKVNNDLMDKYQQLLLAEQQRNDQLMEKYFQLTQPSQVSEESPVEDGGQVDEIESRQESGSVTKFAHLMDIADAQEVIENKRMRVTDLLVRKSGGKNQRRDI